MKKVVIIVTSTICLVAVAGYTAIYLVANTPEAYQSTRTVAPVPTAAEVYRLVNIERSKVGAKSLVEEQALNGSAQFKANDMVARGYFTHEDPQTGKLNGLDYLKERYKGCSYVGENATGGSTSSEVVKKWLSSSSHRDAMLSTKNDLTGVGVKKDKQWYTVVQHFCDLP